MIAKPACSCGIRGFDHSADCAVEVWKRAQPGPPIPCAFVMVCNDFEFLMGRRHGGQAADMWGWPGGKCDRAGTMAQNAVAELREETGILALPSALERLEIGEEWIDAENGQSYPALLFALPYPHNIRPKVTLMEPHKHSAWRWFAPDKLPESTFPAERRAIKAWFGL